MNALLGDPLDRRALLEACLDRRGSGGGPARRQHRAVAARRHRADPVAWTRSTSSACRCPAELCVVLARPDQRLRTADARAVLPRDDAARRRAASGGAGGRHGRGARARRLRAARPRHRRPHRRAGARRAAAGVPRGQGRGARRRRARQLDLGQRPDRLRARARARRRPSAWRRRCEAAYAAARASRARRGSAQVDRAGRARDRDDGGDADEIPDRAPARAGRPASPAATR